MNKEIYEFMGGKASMFSKLDAATAGKPAGNAIDGINARILQDQEKSSGGSSGDQEAVNRSMASDQARVDKMNDDSAPADSGEEAGESLVKSNTYIGSLLETYIRPAKQQEGFWSHAGTGAGAVIGGGILGVPGAVAGGTLGYLGGKWLGDRLSSGGTKRKRPKRY